MKVLRKWDDIEEHYKDVHPKIGLHCFGIMEETWRNLEGKEVEKRDTDGTWRVMDGMWDFHFMDYHVEDVDE